MQGKGRRESFFPRCAIVEAVGFGYCDYNWWQNE